MVACQRDAILVRVPNEVGERGYTLGFQPPAFIFGWFESIMSKIMSILQKAEVRNTLVSLFLSFFLLIL